MPLKTEALCVVLMMVAVVPPFQACRVPSSVTKRNAAGLPFGRLNPLVTLKIWPVGVPVGLMLGSPEGMVTTSGPFVGGGKGGPLPLYSVAKPMPLSGTHHGVAVPREMPHALTRGV